MADDKQAPSKQDKLAEIEQRLKDEAAAEEQSKKSQQAEANPASPGNAEQSSPTSRRTASRKTTAPQQRAKESVKPRSRAGIWAFSLFNFVLIIALAAGGYWLWQQWQSVQEQRSEVAATQTRNAELQRESLNAMNAKLGQLEDANSQRVAQLTETVNQLQQQIQSQQARLNDMSGRRPSDWLIAEADYLVRMAGRKLWLEGDLRTAMLMLQSADSRLQDAADPSLIPVRRLIAEDIQRLNQVNPVSVSSVALAVSGLTKQVDNLTIALPKLPDIAKQEEQVSEEISDWKQNLSRQWQFFVKNLINYQPRTSPIRPLLTEEQQWLIREQLTFALQQAQIAVQQDQPALYYQSLQRALEIIVNHFDTQQSDVVQFTNSLQNLMETDVEKTLPDVLVSAQPLKDLLQQRVNSAFINKGEAL